MIKMCHQGRVGMSHRVLVSICEDAKMKKKKDEEGIKRQVSGGTYLLYEDSDLQGYNS